jgi:16S rRNA (guanine(966)-N(2))-methyltransferase RsmD
MRVISGQAKGRKLLSVRGPGTRPITDRAKSALFSILGQGVRDARFLDLFAGTGQVGIEALSRRAKLAIFVELRGIAIRTIHQNLALTGLGDRADVVHADVFRYLNRNPATASAEHSRHPQAAFDYIYIAPPQYRKLWIRTLRMIDQQPAWLSEYGWAIVQIHPEEYQASGEVGPHGYKFELENLVLFDQRKYGSVMLCFYEQIKDSHSLADQRD